jgi:hypothetical protein
MSFIFALDAEIADLQKEIDADPRQVKLRELKRVRALYSGGGVQGPVSSAAYTGHTITGGGGGAFAGTSSSGTSTSLTSYAGTTYVAPKLSEAASRFVQAAVNAAQLTIDGIPPRTPGRKASPARVQAVQEAIAYLRDKKGPVKTADIYAHIKELQIPIAGGDPQNNLSALLNKAPEFVSHGRAGWTLAGGIFD